jgi:glutaconate CoA-transferase subunit A
MREKLTTLAEAIAGIADGDVVALQNMATQACPMASVRELIRQEKRDLSLVVLVGGMAVDWLAAAGAIKRLIGAAVSMEQFGLCQQYRKAVEQGRVRVEELSESLLNARLGAGARNLPFLPSRGAIGSDLIRLNPDHLRMLEDPFGGPPVVACRALVPDAALIHAHRADRYGNVQYEPTVLWPDIGIMPKAARRVIVTAEEIVETDVLRANPDRTILPGYDSRFHREWVGVSRDDAAAAAFLKRYVVGPASQEQYLECVGGSGCLRRIEAWEESE